MESEKTDFGFKLGNVKVGLKYFAFFSMSCYFYILLKKSKLTNLLISDIILL